MPPISHDPFRPIAPLAREEAEAVAVAAFASLAADSEQMSRFLALTGLEPASLRDVAGEPGFLSAVLDHVLADEALMMSIAENHGHRPERLEAARIALGGHFER